MMPIQIDHLIRTRRRSIALIIRPDGTLEVRAPLALPDKRIHEFVTGNLEWVRRQQARARRSPPPPARSFTEGETFLVSGQPHHLRIVPRQRPALVFDVGGFTLSRSALPKARDYFIRWYKVRALEVVAPLVQTMAKRYGFSYQRIRISSARTRWGSCSSKGTLSFTWRLMMAPPEILDYVVVHELVHTKVHNHSKTFWKGVESILPDYRQRRTWLRKNGKYLTLD